MKTELPSIIPTITPRSPCMCNMFDSVCYVHEFMFYSTAPPVNFVVVGVVSAVIAVVVIVCLVLVVQKYKHRKKTPCEGEITLLLLLLVFVHCYCFSTAPIDQTRTTTENRFVLSHMHVQICWLTTFNFASLFLQRCWRLEGKTETIQYRNNLVFSLGFFIIWSFGVFVIWCFHHNLINYIILI